MTDYTYTTVPQYCTPDYVASVLNLPDPKRPGRHMQFTNITSPSYSEVCDLIAANEDVIDGILRTSWRTNYVYREIFTIPKYWPDEDSVYRDEYIKNAGNMIQLHKNVLDWDPDPVYSPDMPDDTADDEKDQWLLYPGDKIELRQYGGGWLDISDCLAEGVMTNDTFDIDYRAGTLKIRTSYLMTRPKYNSLRITYRYGWDPGEKDKYPMLRGVGIPPSIKRWCGLMTAEQILNSQFTMVKVGTAGNQAFNKDATIANWQKEYDRIYMSMRRMGKVFPSVRK